MALPPGRSPSGASATQVRRYQPPSGWGARSRAAISHSPGRTPASLPAQAASTRGGGDGERVLRRTRRGGRHSSRPA